MRRRSLIAAGLAMPAVARAQPLSYDAVTSGSPEAARNFIAGEAPRRRELVRLSGARIH